MQPKNYTLYNNIQLTLIECPRDAMQGWPHFIPTQQKINYLNALLQVGFNVLDCGSFVSSKAIPQMADSAEVLQQLDLSQSDTKLLAIIANARGANEAAAQEKITYLGFPFSISETFQQRNTNSSITESLQRVEEIQNICISNNKELVVYISMGFGNPYGDEYNAEIVLNRTKQIEALGVKIISIADTVGIATAAEVYSTMSYLMPQFTNTTIGVHLHSTPADRFAKIDAALQAGCTRFDAAMKGIGGCPMAGNELVGNMDTEVMLQHFKQNGYNLHINTEALLHCSKMANSVFI